MSSPLQSARCLRREERAVDIELTPTTATGPCFSLGDFFAFALLHEAATSTVYSSPGVIWRRAGTPAIASLASPVEMIDLACAPPDDPRRTELASRCIASASYVDTHNWSPALFAANVSGAYAGPRLPRTDPRVLAAARALYGIQVAAGSDAHYEAHAPRATLHIEVTDPRWCAHLEPAMIWDVYAFDDEADQLL